MSFQVEGVLNKIASKNGTGRNGRPWTAYSIAVQTATGERWFRMGFDAPKVSEGSYIRFDAEAVPNTTDTFQVVGSPVVDKTASASKPAASAAFAGADTRQDSIVRQNATTTAAKIVDDMLTHGIIALPKAKGKAFDAYLEFIDTVTDRIFLSNRNPKTAEQIIASGTVPVDESQTSDSDGFEDDPWGDDE